MRSQLCFSFSFCFLFLLLLLLFPSSNSMSPPEILTASSNQTIVSPGNYYELGFFQHEEYSSLWYLGIWYKDDPKRTVLWVANRDKPFFGSNGTLKFFDNNLVLFDRNDSIVWSTNLTEGDVRSLMVAELLDNGNFVVKDSNNLNGYLWQSFDYPTDTLLPQMKIKINKVLIAWKYPTEPSSGASALELKNQAGIFELFVCLQEISECLYRSGAWDGIRFGDMLREIFQLDHISSNWTGIAGSSFLMTGQNRSRLTLSWAGAELQLYTWVPERKRWSLTWNAFSDNCNKYGLCGPYGYCSRNTKCNCIEGFDIMSPKDWENELWSGGCKRRTHLSCGGDEFLLLKNMKLPDAKNVTVDKEIGFEECEKRCRMNCNCTAFAHVGILKGQRGCVFWTGKLNDMRNFTVGGQNLYVKLAAKDLG